MMHFSAKFAFRVKHNNLIFFTALTLLCLLWGSSHALSPEPKLANQQQEQRAMVLFLEVRCLVCNGQVIENSDTEFSFEMRKLIRRKIESGMSDIEIKTYLKDKFGADILTEISPNGLGFLLWYSPFIFAILLIFFNLKFFKKTSTSHKEKKES